MALNYSVALRPNPLKKDEPAKAYATAQINGCLLYTSDAADE